MKRFTLLLIFIDCTASASCPKSPKEWKAKAPKIFIEKASQQNAPIEITNFSSKLGKKGASAKAFPFKERKQDFVMVEAKDEENSLFLSGVLRCDPLKKEPSLLSLTYVKGNKSGFVKISLP